MSTFLQLCKDLRREAGIAGTGPAGTTTQTGENERLVEWINAAWLSIQQLHDEWRFMRGSDSLTTVNGTKNYAYTDFAAISAFRRWLPDTFRCYITATGVSDEQDMVYVPYREWRDVYGFASNTTTTGRPTHFTIRPDDTIDLYPIPDATGYTVTADYQKAATELSGDSDEPELPSEFHNLIVWRALMHYGMFESAGEVVARARDEYHRTLTQVRKSQLPECYIAGPLV